MGLQLSNKIKTSDSRELLVSKDQPSHVSVELRLSCSSESSESYEKIDVLNVKDGAEFRLKYESWKRETFATSFINTNNSHIRDFEIKEDFYLPYMYEDLKNGDYSIVRLLELLMPEEIHYPGLLSQKQASRIWLKILQKRITN